MKYFDLTNMNKQNDFISGWKRKNLEPIEKPKTFFERIIPWAYGLVATATIIAFSYFFWFIAEKVSSIYNLIY